MKINEMFPFAVKKEVITHYEREMLVEDVIYSKELQNCLFRKKNGSHIYRRIKCVDLARIYCTSEVQQSLVGIDIGNGNVTIIEFREQPLLIGSTVAKTVIVVSDALEGILITDQERELCNRMKDEEHAPK